METFFTLSIIMFACISAIFFGWLGFCIVFLIGVIVQMRERKKKYERDIMEQILKIIKIQVGKQ